MESRHMTSDEIKARYPRLVAAIGGLGYLTENEAAHYLRDYRDGFARVNLLRDRLRFRRHYRACGLWPSKPSFRP